MLSFLYLNALWVFAMQMKLLKAHLNWLVT